jgi:hypothetical protein
MLARLLGLAVLCAACGTNRPDIPDELLQTGTGGGSAGYPEGPYAANFKTDVGKVIPNLTFEQGWMDPAAAAGDVSLLAPISFSDFYDPDGTKGNEIMLINTAAIWCGACKGEHGGTTKSPSLSEHYTELRPKGFVILSLLFEDNSSNPATVNHLATWVETYETNFPFALDPAYQMEVFGSPKANAPLNLAVDLRNMKLLAGWVGDQSQLIWPFIEQELDARQAQ